MYFLSVLLFMLIAPAGSVWAEHWHFHIAAPLMLLVGKWFVFWGVGVRLTIAGRQNIQPRFTSEEILGIKGDDPLPFVRELGMANLATGVVGLLSLWQPPSFCPSRSAPRSFTASRASAMFNTAPRPSTKPSR